MKKTMKKTFEQYGSEGGKKTLEKYGKNHFSKIAKRRHKKEKRNRNAPASKKGGAKKAQ